MKIECGDWIRFQRNGVLVIGVVTYTKVHPNEIHFNDAQLITDNGSCYVSEVLEFRRQSILVDTAETR